MKSLGLLQAETFTKHRVFADYKDRPVEFIERFLHTNLTDKQVQIAEACLVHERIAVKAGQKTGKSRLDVCLIVWWVCTRADGKGLITSASYEQVKDPLWSELTALYHATDGSIFPEPALDPNTGIRWADGRTIRGIATNKKERAAGKSGAGLFIILDEASGIKAEIAEAFEGNTMGGGVLLATSNPTEVSGFFFDCFHSKRKYWKCFTLSGRETPNYLLGRNVIPGMATRAKVDEIIELYGENSVFVDVRVDGKFPKTSTNAVISLGLIEEALARWPKEAAESQGQGLDIGVDVARFGDDSSSVCGRRGLCLYSPRWFEEERDIKAVVKGYDAMAVTGVVIQCMRALRRKGGPGEHDETVRIKIDSAGGYGTAVVDMLNHLKDLGNTPGLDDNVHIIEVNVGEASTEPEKYPRLRSEVWFSGRKFIKAGGAIYPDPGLEHELIAPIYKVTPKGQLEVEKKEETKKRLGRSPDRADSALLAIYEATGIPVNDVIQPFATSSRWEGTGRGF